MKTKDYCKTIFATPHSAKFNVFYSMFFSCLLTLFLEDKQLYDFLLGPIVSFFISITIFSGIREMIDLINKYGSLSEAKNVVRPAVFFNYNFAIALLAMNIIGNYIIFPIGTNWSPSLSIAAGIIVPTITGTIQMKKLPLPWFLH